jgi:hypothetical protein
MAMNLQQIRKTQCVKIRCQTLRLLHLNASLTQLNINNLYLPPLTSDPVWSGSAKHAHAGGGF